MLHLELGMELAPEQQLVAALDTSNISKADRLAGITKKAGGLVIKEGLELFTQVSPKECSELAADHGLDWIADFKFKATSKTNIMAITNIVDLKYPPIGITVATESGLESLTLAQRIANKKGIMIFGSGLLSTVDEDEIKEYYNKSSKAHMLAEANRAVNAGIGGIVCSGAELPLLKSYHHTKKLFTLVVGTRSEGVTIKGEDQKRIITPRIAKLEGADLIVFGREFTEARGPLKAYRNAVQAMSQRAA